MAAKVQIDPTFEKRMRDLRDSAKNAGDNLCTTNRVKHQRPSDWASAPHDTAAITPLFKADKASHQYVLTLSSYDNPGTVGDIVTANLMVAHLGVHERAFRVRHTLRGPRAAALAAGRYRSQGEAKGAFISGNVEILRKLMEEARATELVQQ